jgi:hypothetical protein|tara:strand:- start:399 stop:797 length:399 start_codon:yes stop_codon:yes gene_type:complete
MPALNTDTRLVMTILFVGTVSGANVFFYATYGTNFPYTPLAHSVLFGLITVGSIMCMKALFDISLNDKIELWLLDRKISAYWARMARDEEQRKKLQDTAKSYNLSPYTGLAPMAQSYESENTVSSDFLTTLQ